MADRDPQFSERAHMRIHGKAVTCTECGDVLPVDLPDGADVPEFVFPAFRDGDLIHPDGSRCDMGVGA